MAAGDDGRGERDRPAVEPVGSDVVGDPAQDSDGHPPVGRDRHAGRA